MKVSRPVIPNLRGGLVTRSLRSALRRDWQLYLLLVLPVAFVLIFKYAAYPGLRIAFMNFKPARGFSGSEYVGLDIFRKIFKMKAIADQGLSYSDPVFAVAIEAESEYNATLLSLFKEYSVLLTKCAPEEFDDLYAELNQKYLDAGYQDIIDERLAAYEAGQTTKLPVAP